MRKLFYFCPTFYPSPTGFGVAFTNIVKLIADANHFDKIIIITTDKTALIPEELKKICEIYYIRIRGAGKISIFPNFISYSILKFMMKDLLRYLDSKKPTSKDIFFYEEFFIAFFKFVVEKIYSNNEHYIRVHGTLPEFAKNSKKFKYAINFFKQGINNKNNKVVSTTNFYIEYFNENFFKNSYDIIQGIDYFILPNALVYDNKIINKNEKKLDDKLKLFQLGRMDEEGYFQKGFDDSIKALQYIESNNPDIAKEIIFTVIGDGTHAKIFEEKIKKIQTIEIIYMKKAQNFEVQEIIDDADIILMPSRCEGMSMFATESIYKGKAMIFTAKNGLRDYLKNNINGFSIEEYDYTEMANAIIKYFYNRNLIVEHGNNNIEFSKYITTKTKACIDVIFKGSDI